MALSLFGITYSNVRAHFFPSLADFSGSTKPTSTAVGEMIDSAAADLNGRLAAVGVTAADLDSSGEPAAYAWCKDYVRLASAIRVCEALTGAGQVPKFWREELKAKQDALEKYGHTVLGDAPTPDQLSAGPRSHLTNHDLDTGEETLISDAIPRFRRDDEL
jgi:hypothetical protein